MDRSDVNYIALYYVSTALYFILSIAFNVLHVSHLVTFEFIIILEVE